MARTGRPKSTVQKFLTHVNLLPEHVKMFEQIDFDPFTAKRVVGMRDIHIERALNEYFEKYYPEMYTSVLTGDK